jgi:hypothetical protein
MLSSSETNDFVYVKQCPHPSSIYTGRSGILDALSTFYRTVGKRHVMVLYGLGGGGKSQIGYKFVQQCQASEKTNRYVIINKPERVDLIIECLGSQRCYT